jgi:hypothetical protein
MMTNLYIIYNHRRKFIVFRRTVKQNIEEGCPGLNPQAVRKNSYGLQTNISVQESAGLCSFSLVLQCQAERRLLAEDFDDGVFGGLDLSVVGLQQTIRRDGYAHCGRHANPFNEQGAIRILEERGRRIEF